MAMQDERGETRIDQPGPLHNGDGTLACPGYATSLLLEYHRKNVKASAWRIKEWDYYLVNDDEYAVALTLSYMGYAGLVSVSLIDFAQAAYKTTSVITPFPFGRFHLPESSASGVSSFENSRVALSFEAADGQRRLRATFRRFDGDEDLTFEALLDEEPRDTMVIATPWAEDELAFYYNQKIVAMQVRGSFKKGTLVHGFRPENSFGLLDWGRGVWTRDNTWFWAVGQGWQHGPVHKQGKAGARLSGASQAGGRHRFGLNLGYGFGDTSAASENMAFVDGAAVKLGRVDFGIPQKRRDARKIADRYELMQPWHMTDGEGRLDLMFTPAIDRIDYMDFKLIRSDQHQVFGTFDGTVVLDDGTRFPIEGLRGSAEVIHNVY